MINQSQGMGAEGFTQGRPTRILLVEDNPNDAELTVETLKSAKMHNPLNIVEDGIEAMDFLLRRDRYTQAPRPDLVLLDLNLPRMNGRQVLSEMRADAGLKDIPVLVLTASQDDRDILETYKMNKRCYLTKPLDMRKFLDAVRSIEQFWLSVVNCP